MIYMVPTKRGVGVQIWGTYDDLDFFRGGPTEKTDRHFSMEDLQYLGTQISWVHFLFTLAGLKYAMNYQGMSKMDVALILQLEYWLEKAMRSTNADFIMLGGGKRAFRKLPELLKKGVLGNDEYHDYKDVLMKEAKRLNCTIDNLEIMDDHVNYEMPW